jgi:hypothetical protein
VEVLPVKPCGNLLGEPEDPRQTLKAFIRPQCDASNPTVERRESGRECWENMRERLRIHVCERDGDPGFGARAKLFVRAIHRAQTARYPGRRRLLRCLDRMCGTLFAIVAVCSDGEGVRGQD